MGDRSRRGGFPAKTTLGLQICLQSLPDRPAYRERHKFFRKSRAARPTSQIQSSFSLNVNVTLLRQ
ncbi:MAG: hypothetical protein C4325_08305 [Blastocatellia bacterium]